jgi:hypothetical protein
MKPKFIQENCVEGNRIDLRQARLIARRKPNIVLLELPAGPRGPQTVFNRHPLGQKPLAALHNIERSLRITARKYPYALSDVAVWKNIATLWKSGHDVLVFNIDGPRVLRRAYFGKYGSTPYPVARKMVIFWVHLYLREQYMANYIRTILQDYHAKKNPIVAVFLQSIHWRDVKFLLKNPSKKEIWKYYFGRFPEITPTNIAQEIKKESIIHYKYWEKTSPFRTLKDH